MNPLARENEVQLLRSRVAQLESKLMRCREHADNQKRQLEKCTESLDDWETHAQRVGVSYPCDLT